MLKGKTDYLPGILLMYVCYIIWAALDGLCYVYFYSSKGLLILYGNMYKTIPGLFICLVFIIVLQKTERKYVNRKFLLLAVSLGITIMTAVLDTLISTQIYNIMRGEGISIAFARFITPFSKWILFFTGSGMLYLFITYQKRTIEQEYEIKMAEALASEARLAMLRYQINPGFLFDSLNAIKGVARIDKERGKEMIGELSEYFRYTVSKNENMMVMLSEELDAVNNYLSIQKASFGNSLIVEKVIEAEVLNHKFPFYILPPLVDFTLKKGLNSNNGIADLYINIKQLSNDIVINIGSRGTLSGNSAVVNNNLEQEISGLDNIKNRMNSFYPGRSSFSLYEKEGFIRAEIKIPAENSK